ncbi:MAG: hypothetical protein U9P42_08730 [Candidatus Fermentibacteria bacterium]|nr:hypothetical protein [Candidatus Fermentibacteria bacterium]
MKLLVSALAVASVVVASDGGYFGTSEGIHTNNPPSATITLTLLNDWPQTCHVYGLDVYENSGDFYVLGSDNNSGRIRFYDPADGTVTTTYVPYSSGNDGCFGIAYDNGPDSGSIYTNDWSDNVLYHTENWGSSWTTVSSPGSTQIRGMDFDGTYYWCTDNTYPKGVWRFQPGGSQEFFATPTVTAQPSGLTVFPYNGNLGIAISCYSLATMEFYQWDGSALAHIGSASYPAAIDYDDIFGLAYAATNGHIYMSYKDYYGGGLHHLTELSFDITSLERSSWGSIKTSF